MKNAKLSYFILGAVLIAARNYAADFSSGSTGEYGEMHIAQDTVLDLPPDGVFNCTTITVDAGTSLTFRKNALNTPVYLLATGDVSILGTIQVNGQAAILGIPGVGGPGGFDGGFGSYGTGDHSTGGDGKGPGRGLNIGRQHSAVYGNALWDNNRSYGNSLLSPLIGGSGGSGFNGNPGNAGGGGGGAILIASPTKIQIVGQVWAIGGNGAPPTNRGYGGGAGSGGAVRLISPIVSGEGTVDASGGNGFDDNVGSLVAGQGRIRIDCLDRYSFRTLRMYGRATQGSQMFVFPPITRRLDIIEAAGQSIPTPASTAASITLAAGSDPNQKVKVAADGFVSNVPITVVVTPETGSSSTYNAEIPIGPDKKGEVAVDVVLSVGNINQIHVWTR